MPTTIDHNTQDHRVLSAEQYEALANNHTTRLSPFLYAHRDRVNRGQSHPVYDFLFTYYNLRPRVLLQWHPGLHVTILGKQAHDMRGFRSSYQQITGKQTGQSGICLTLSAVMKQRNLLQHIRAVLSGTESRKPVFHCFAMHEWAMVYRTTRQDQERRHNQIPLRLSPEHTDRIVEATTICCTHYDAYRFFTVPEVNTLALTRETQLTMEQPGCIHAHMDLYKWAAKLLPLISSDIVADAFELARDAREIDMRASPYDLSSVGFDPISVETIPGRAEYVKYQHQLLSRAKPIRRTLIEHCDNLLTAIDCPAH